MTSDQFKVKYFDPTIVDFGFVRAGEKLPFVIKNNSDINILSHRKSCGCLGESISDATTVRGELTATYAAPFETLYNVDGEYCQQIAQGDTVRFFNVVKKGWAETPTVIGPPIKVTKFEKSITVIMDDNQTEEVVNERGESVENTNKLKVNIPVRAYILPAEK